MTFWVPRIQTYIHTYMGMAWHGVAWQLRTSPCVLHVSAASFNFHRANRALGMGVCNTVSDISLLLCYIRPPTCHQLGGGGDSGEDSFLKVLVLAGRELTSLAAADRRVDGQII